MRKILAALFIIMLLAPNALANQAGREEISLKVGETYLLDAMDVQSAQMTVAGVVDIMGDLITALAPGDTEVIITAADGTATLLFFTVAAASDIPALIQAGIDVALGEWEENLGKTFSKLGKTNKYARWQCGTGAGCNIGWCGAFIGYCLDEAGIPMEKYRDCVLQEDGAPHSVREAGVGKIYTGFETMNRLSDVPRPGYLVIYGKKGGYQYLHVGLVTDVVDNGDGTYILSTVEGNVSSRIKRYQYLYDINGGKNNFKDCPEEMRTHTEEDVFQYTKHNKEWCINIFCQTWY